MSQPEELPEGIFIESQHLGILLNIAKDALLGDHTKRMRGQKFRELAKLLRGLKLIPSDKEVRYISLGLNEAGVQGLLVHVSVASTVKAEGPQASDICLMCGRGEGKHFIECELNNKGKL